VVFDAADLDRGGFKIFQEVCGIGVEVVTGAVGQEGAAIFRAEYEVDIGFGE